MADFNEADHPRASDGKFGSGGGGGSAPKLTPTQKSYISSYTGDDFLETNKALRDGKSGGPSVKHIDEAIAKSTVPAGTRLYRGMDREAAKKFIGGRDIKAGMEISDKAFMSTSKSKANFGYGGFGGVQFEIDVGDDQHGLDVSALTRNPSEQEVLLPRDTKMRVQSIVPPKNVGDPVIIRVSTVSGDDRSRADAVSGVSEVLYSIRDQRMIRAAGILFIAQTGAALFVKRADDGTWAFPGGHIEAGETAEEAATRECVEEIGTLPAGDRTLWTRRIANNEIAAALAPDAGLPPTDAMVVPAEQVDFTTFLQRIPEQFTPALNDESTGYAWADPDQPPEPLHPGARIALARLTMDELGIARAIAAGELTSPQRYENVSLFDIRITGVGAAYRGAKKDPKTGKILRRAEFCWRDSSIYLNDDFLARCNGLPVIFEHPERATLDSDEFADRIVGTVFLPYIKGDEVWAVAKIFDDATISILELKQYSTSPSVFFEDPTVNETVTLQDGTNLLIEDKPSLLDHIAIVPRGVWDKAGDPVGVNSATIGDTMTEEEKAAAAAKAKADADEATKAKADADEKAKADADNDRWSKLDSFMDSMCKRMDAFEKKADVAGDLPGTPEEVAADKARKDAEEKAKADAEEEKAKEEKARADADEIRKKIADLDARMPKEISDADNAALADAQAKADSVASAFGDAAPRPLQGETLLGYRKRLAGKFKGHSRDWKDVDLARLDDVSFGVIESKIYADAMDVALRPIDAPAGMLREISRVDPDTGHRTRRFVGDPEACWGEFKSPSRRARLNLNRAAA